MRTFLAVSLRNVLSAAFALFIAYMSAPVIINMISSRQLMNSSFDAYRLVNTYGAFGRCSHNPDYTVYLSVYSLYSACKPVFFFTVASRKSGMKWCLRGRMRQTPGDFRMLSGSSTSSSANQVHVYCTSANPRSTLITLKLFNLILPLIYYRED